MMERMMSGGMWVMGLIGLLLLVVLILAVAALAKYLFARKASQKRDPD